MHTPTESPAKMFAVAKPEAGYKESYSGGHWTNHEKFAAQVPGMAWVSDQGQPWCAVFISWVAMKAGFAELFPRTASTDVGARWFKDKKAWSEYPAIGAQGFLGHNGDMFHTFLVLDFDDTYVYTIEGNTIADGQTGNTAEGDGVHMKKRLRRSAEIAGYGYPAYPEGIVSADPAWAKKAPRRKHKKIVVEPKKPAPKGLIIPVGTSNVCSLPRHDHTIHHTVHAAAEGVQIIGWQEVDNKVYRDAIRSIEKYDTYFGGANNTFNAPISWNKNLWRMVDHGTEFFIEGANLICYDRHITWVELERISDPSIRIIVTSRHQVASAWGPFGGPKRKRGDRVAQRQAMWNSGNRVDITLLTKLAESGLPILVMGDYNRPVKWAYPKTLAGRKVQAVSHGIDWIYFIDGASKTWSLGQTKTRKVGSDHAELIKTATLK